MSLRKISSLTCLLFSPIIFCSTGVRAAATTGALANYAIVGSTDGGQTYSNSITVTAGQTVNFEVLGYLSPVGTTNTSANKTITTLVNGDDIIGNNFNLSEVSTATIPITFTQSTLSSKYSAGSGQPSGGVISNSTVSNIYAAAAGAGATYPTAASPTLVLTGVFVVGNNITLNSTATVTGAYDFADAGGGSFKINSGPPKTITVTNATENAAQPLEDYLDLTLSSAPTPEPATLSLLVFPSILLCRRRYSRVK